MSHTFVIINRKGEFFGRNLFTPTWKKEYTNALVLTDRQDAIDLWKDLTPLMTKIIRDYGTPNETSEIYDNA